MHALSLFCTDEDRWRKIAGNSQNIKKEWRLYYDLLKYETWELTRTQFIIVKDSEDCHAINKIAASFLCRLIFSFCHWIPVCSLNTITPSCFSCGQLNTFRFCLLMPVSSGTEYQIFCFLIFCQSCRSSAAKRPWLQISAETPTKQQKKNDATDSPKWCRRRRRVSLIFGIWSRDLTPIHSPSPFSLNPAVKAPGLTQASKTPSTATPVTLPTPPIFSCLSLLCVCFF